MSKEGFFKYLYISNLFLKKVVSKLEPLFWTNLSQILTIRSELNVLKFAQKSKFLK